MSSLESLELQPAELVPGYRLDRYELLCPIAQGGMASVWIARLRGKHGFERLVAIKTILPEYAQDPRFERMFLDEAHIASKIEHVNVAQILDLGEQGSVLYLVMELVDGEALSKLHRALERKGEKLPHGVLLRILADACAGLHAAHELADDEGQPLGVVHRDVSPQNILVSAKGVAKVIDFGIAKARDRVAGETGSGLLKGKIQYMAPEQALGKVVDRRADVWAIGAVLYQMLVGRPPYDAPNQLATLHLLSSGRPPLPLPTSIPAPIVKVVKRAMTHDLDKRFATALEMQRAIEDAMIEMGMRATATDVAALLLEHVGDRRDQRKQAIDLALRAAAERQRVLSLAGPTSSESGSGVGPRPISFGSEAITLAGAPSSQQGRLISAPPGALEVSNATLGSAAIASPVTGRGEPSRRRPVVIALASVGVALAIGAAALIAIRSGKRDPIATSSKTSGTDVRAATPAATTVVAAASQSLDTSVASAPAPSTSEAATASSIAASASAAPSIAKTQWPGPLVLPTKGSTSAATTGSAAPIASSVKIDDGF